MIREMTQTRSTGTPGGAVEFYKSGARQAHFSRGIPREAGIAAPPTLTLREDPPRPLSQRFVHIAGKSRAARRLTCEAGGYLFFLLSRAGARPGLGARGAGLCSGQPYPVLHQAAGHEPQGAGAGAGAGWENLV